MPDDYTPLTPGDEKTIDDYLAFINAEPKQKARKWEEELMPEYKMKEEK